jgi:hypothetical protein
LWLFLQASNVLQFIAATELMRSIVQFLKMSADWFCGLFRMFIMMMGSDQHGMGRPYNAMRLTEKAREKSLLMSRKEISNVLWIR